MKAATAGPLNLGKNHVQAIDPPVIGCESSCFVKGISRETVTHWKSGTKHSRWYKKSTKP